MRIYDDMVRTERWSEEGSVTVRAVQDFSFKVRLVRINFFLKEKLFEDAVCALNSRLVWVWYALPMV